MLPFFVGWAIYNKYFQNQSFSFNAFLLQIDELKISVFVILLIMSMFNWLIEAQKWRTILLTIEPISFSKALKSVLAGLAVSQLFPNKTGEYIGRMAFVSDNNKIQAAVLSVWASMSQLIVTLVFGMVSLLFIHPLIDPSFVIVCLLIFIVAILMYILLPKFASLFKKYAFYNYIKDFKQISIQLILEVFFYSVLRYFVFALPYVFLIILMSENAKDLPFHLVFFSVSCIYLLQTISPNFIFSDVLIRIAIPALVFKDLIVFKNQVEYVPSLLIYLINVVVPMLIGTVIVLFYKFRKTTF